MRGISVQDDVVWVEALELSVDFQGPWRWEVQAGPPFAMLIAEATDAPLALELYPMDVDRFANAREVARDLVQSRLGRAEREEVSGGEERASVVAEGYEGGAGGGARVRIYAQVAYEHDAFYVMAFSGPPEVIAAEQWRLDAMMGSAVYGSHRAHGRGVKGLINLMESRISESDVPVGYSRSQLGTVRGRGIAHNLGPMKRRKAHFTERGATWLGERLTGQPEPRRRSVAPPRDALDAGILTDDLGEFEARLARPESRPLPSYRDEELEAFEAQLAAAPVAPAPLRWPAPWEPLSNLDGGRGQRRAQIPSMSLKASSRERRELEIVGFAQGIGADVAWYAERIYGVGVEPSGLRDAEPFPVVGLDRVPLLVEASLRLLQSELDAQEPLELGAPRRALSPLGRSVPAGHGLLLGEALRAMAQEDDATAADLIGWTVGWREAQERLPALGLLHHTMLVPSRARALAFTDLEGPLAGLDLETRLDLWRAFSEEERRATLGQLHRAHLETPLEVIEADYMRVMRDASIPLALKARWSLALGPRGTAQEYGRLMAALHRGEVLSPALSAQVLGLLKPCLGDPLSPALFGVDMVAGKLGQDVGSLGAAGVLGKIDGGEVAICVLLKNIKTIDYTGVVEQLHLLGRLLYQLMTE